MKPPQDEVTLSPAEGEALIERLEQNTLSAEDRCRLVQVVRWLFGLLWIVQEAKLSLKRLRTLMFGTLAASSSAEDAVGSMRLGEADQGREAEPIEAPLGASTEHSRPEGPSHPAPGGQGRRRGGHRPGQGRHGATVYENAERVTCHHEALRVGEVCPVCGHGRLYTLPPGVAIRLDGNALVSAIRYELEKLRCSACGMIFTAPLPAAAGAEKYTPRARAVLVVSRYYLGLPLYRVEAYQAMLRVPVPDATQWDQIERVADCGYVVFAQLERLAAQGELIYQDDTSVRILALIKENHEAQAHAAQGVGRTAERTGMYTTVLLVKVGEWTICLYYSGRAHAGENLQALLAQRKVGHGQPLVMSDALASNAADEATLIRCHCLAHGRRKFSDLLEVFPQECRVVIDVLKQVFDHDEEARDQQMSPQARLAYHQAQSRPRMAALQKWLDTQVTDCLIEPTVH